MKKLQKRNSNNIIILIYPIPEVGWNVRQKLINSSPKKFSLSKDYYIPKEWITTSYEVYKKRTKSMLLRAIMFIEFILINYFAIQKLKTDVLHTMIKIFFILMIIILH